MRLSRAASGAQQADQRRNRYARGCGRVHGVAPWAGGGCYAAVPSDQALMPSVHSKWMLCGMGRAIGTAGTSDATRIQPLPSNCIGHVRCTGRDAHAAGLPLHLSNCWSLSDRHQPLCGLRWLACAPKHADF